MKHQFLHTTWVASMAFLLVFSASASADEVRTGQKLKSKDMINSVPLPSADINRTTARIAPKRKDFTTIDVVKKGQKVRTRDMTISTPFPPVDIYRPSGSVGPKHEDLATFAWLEFIALSAPVSSSLNGVATTINRGVPGGSFADSGMDQAATLVWETYQHRAELFPYTDGSAVPPQAWNTPPTYQVYLENNSVITPYEVPAEVSRFNNLDEATQIGQNAIFFPDLEEEFDDSGETGLDQILFQAKVNQVQSDYIRSRVESGATDPIDLDDGTIEIKSAWIPLTSIPEDQQYRYHIAEVTVYGGEDGAPVPETQVRALVGLHIIQKTPNFPSFIFATFEHTDLLEDPMSHAPTELAYVPTYDEIAYTVADTSQLFGIDGQPVVDNPDIGFDVNSPVATPNGESVDLPLGSVANIPGAIDIGDGQSLIPVVQPLTTNKDVDKANKDALKAMSQIEGFDDSFVWQYYQLKGVQGVPSSNDSDNDFYLANIVIESSQPGVQLFRGGFAIATANGVTTLTNSRNQADVYDEAQSGATFSQGGCQGCHGVAQTKAGFDFSFLIGGQNGKGFTPDTSGVKDQEVMLRRLQRYSELFN